MCAANVEKDGVVAYCNNNFTVHVGTRDTRHQVNIEMDKFGFKVSNPGIGGGLYIRDLGVEYFGPKCNRERFLGWMYEIGLERVDKSLVFPKGMIIRPCVARGYNSFSKTELSDTSSSIIS